MKYLKKQFIWKFKKFPQLTNSIRFESDLFGCCSLQFQFGSFQLLDERILIEPRIVAEVSSGKYISLKDERFTSKCELKLIEKCFMCAAGDDGRIRISFVLHPCHQPCQLVRKERNVEVRETFRDLPAITLH